VSINELTLFELDSFAKIDGLET